MLWVGVDLSGWEGSLDWSWFSSWIPFPATLAGALVSVPTRALKATTPALTWPTAPFSNWADVTVTGTSLAFFLVSTGVLVWGWSSSLEKIGGDALSTLPWNRKGQENCLCSQCTQKEDNRRPRHLAFLLIITHSMALQACVVSKDLVVQGTAAIKTKEKSISAFSDRTFLFHDHFLGNSFTCPEKS